VCVVCGVVCVCVLYVCVWCVVCVCCVWDSLQWVWGSEGVCVCVFCVCVVWCVCVCVLRVGQFGACLVSECAAGGFVVFVYRHCVAVSRGN